MRVSIGLLTLFMLPLASAAPVAEQLRADYARVADALADSPFDRPLVIDSSERASRLDGTVRALVDVPFDRFAALLSKAQPWCELLVLTPSIRQCRASGDGRQLQLRFARRFDQPLADTHAIDFDVRVEHHPGTLLDVALSAAQGPLGTSGYRVELQAIPLDGRSYLRIGYGYSYGFSARLAAQAYLATRGAGKVGFSRAGADYIGGLRGSIERNAVRLYLAIEAYLATLHAPARTRHERALRHWLAAIEQYPRQLAEPDPDAYFRAKREHP